MARTDVVLAMVDLTVMKEIATVFFAVVFVVVLLQLFARKDGSWGRHARLPLEDGVIEPRNERGTGGDRD